MHMHTLKIALVQPSGTFDLDRFTGPGDRPARSDCRRSVDACCRCRSTSSTRSGSPTVRSTWPGTSSSTRSRSPAAWRGSRTDRRDREHAARPLRAALGDARLRAVRRRPGRPSSRRCTTPSPTATPPTPCSPHLTDLPGLLAEVGTMPVAEPHPPLDPTPSKLTQVWLALRDGDPAAVHAARARAPHDVGRRGGRATTQEGDRRRAPAGPGRPADLASTARSPPVASYATCTFRWRTSGGKAAHAVTLNDVRRSGGRLRRPARLAGNARGAPDRPLAGRGARRHRPAGAGTRWAATGSPTCSPRWPPTSTTRPSGCAGSPRRRTSRRSCSAPSGRTCSSTGCSSRRPHRSARPCGSTPARARPNAPAAVQRDRVERAWSG